MEGNVHVGNIIRQYIDRMNIKRSDIARKMELHHTIVYTFEKRHSLQSKNMLQLCHALRYNLFRDIADRLPADYTSSNENPYTKQIAEQAEQIKKLQWENELLKELIAKRG